MSFLSETQSQGFALYGLLLLLLLIVAFRSGN